MAIESPVDSDVRMDMGALWGAIRRRLLRIVLVTAILLAGTYALLLFVPKSYESTSSILVENRDSAYTQPAVGGASAGATQSPASMISSQIELVKSRDTLLDVVRSQNLTQVPEFNGTKKSPLDIFTRFFKKPSSATPEDIAVDTLAEHLMAVRERDSALINISVSSADPELAAKLANAVARADVTRRAGQSISDTADASQWLEQQITQLRQRVADAENKVANFKVANDLYTGANSTSLLDQQLTDISAQITAAQGRRSTAQSRATLIRGLIAAGQPIDGIDDVRNSVTIQQLMQQKAQLTSQKAQLLATLLPTHPSVEAVTAQIAAVDRQIAIEGRRVADALDAEAKIEDASIVSLQKNLADLKAKAGAATKQGVTLDALDREAKADRDLLESYMTRYRDAAARTDPNASLPDLRLITLAAPATSPSSPKTTLILGAVGFVSIAVQLGAILFGELLSGRALIDRDQQADEYAAVPEAAVDEVDGSTPEPYVPADEQIQDIDESGQSEEAAPPAIELDEAENAGLPAVVAPRRVGVGGLRAWFRRRAHTVTAALAAYEPPLAATPSSVASTDAPPVEDEARPFVSPETMEVLPLRSDDVEESASDLDLANAERLANLSADLILGRARVIMLASLDGNQETERLASRLVADVLHRGLSLARVDAGSGHPSTEPGITDLAAERASFGDVVHKTAEDGLAEVPWGHLTTLDRRSARPLTLIEALSDIYEVVLVMTGRVGMSSSLPLFAGLPCRLVLVSAAMLDASQMDEARLDAAALGYDSVEFIVAPPPQARVA